MKEIIETLPRNWETAQLGDLVEILDHLRIPVNRSERSERPGPYPYYGATGQVGWIDDFLFSGEYILLGEDGAPFLEPHRPKAYLVRGKFWVNNHAHVLKPKGGVLGQYLVHQLNQVDYRDFVSGTTRLKLPQAPMRRIPIRLAPETEQQRIVAELEKQLTRVDAGAEDLRRTQANLKRYRATVLKAACEGRLVPATEVAQAAPRSDTSDIHDLESMLPVIPEGWRWANLGDLIAEGPQNGVYLPRELYGSGNPIVRIDDFQDWWSRKSQDLLRVETDAKVSESYSLRAGDILINRVNSPSHLGKCLLISGKHLPAIFESNMMRIKLVDGADPEYIAVYLRSPLGRYLLTRNAKWAVNQASINQKDIANTPVALPPRAEQKRIVSELGRILSELERLDIAIVSQLSRAKILCQAILQHAFSGRLVQQNPSDEPAPDLLERIRLERTSAAADQPSRRGRRPATNTEKPRSRRVTR